MEIKKNYKNSKIYVIKSKQTDKIYIGSTILPLNIRFTVHKSDYKRWENNKHFYLTSFDIVKYDDCCIELLKECPCNSNEELHMLEGEIIRNTQNCVNKCIAGRTTKEYYQTNRETILNDKKTRIVCECGREYTKCNKNRHKQSKFHSRKLNLM